MEPGGYAVATAIAPKLTYVSPVWLQAKGKDGTEIGGTHDVNTQWMDEVRAAGVAGGAPPPAHRPPHVVGGVKVKHTRRGGGHGGGGEKIRL